MSTTLVNSAVVGFAEDPDQDQHDQDQQHHTQQHQHHHQQQQQQQQHLHSSLLPDLNGVDLVMSLSPKPGQPQLSTSSSNGVVVGSNNNSNANNLNLIGSTGGHLHHHHHHHHQLTSLQHLQSSLQQHNTVGLSTAAGSVGLSGGGGGGSHHLHHLTSSGSSGGHLQHLSSSGGLHNSVHSTPFSVTDILSPIEEYRKLELSTNPPSPYRYGLSSKRLMLKWCTDYSYKIRMHMVIQNVYKKVRRITESHIY